MLFELYPWYTGRMAELLLGSRRYGELLAFGAQCLEAVRASARACPGALGQGLSQVSQGLRGLWLMAWGLVPQGFQEALLRQEAVIYGRWLLYYGYWDFFNGGFCALVGAEGLLPRGLAKKELLRLAREFLGVALGTSLGASLGAPLGVAFGRLEASLDACWLELVTQALAWGFHFQGSDELLSIYSLKYWLWGQWQFFFDALCLDHKLKPLQLAWELVAKEDNHLFEENLYYEYFRSYNDKRSYLHLLHEPYVVWTLRQAAVSFDATVLTAGSSGNRGAFHKAGSWAVDHYLNFCGALAVLLLSSKGLRQVLGVPASQPYSGSYEWRAFRELPTAAAVDALVHVPHYVEQQYRGEQNSPGEEFFVYPGKPWKFYKLALLALEDFYGTRDPVEALELMLRQGGGPLGQRLATQGLLRRR